MFSRAPSTVLRSVCGCRASTQPRNVCNGLGTRRRHPARERGEQLGQVVGGPVAGHVGLAEADLGVRAEPVKEVDRPVASASAARPRRRRRTWSRPANWHAHRQPVHHEPEQPLGRVTRAYGECGTARRSAQGCVAGAFAMVIGRPPAAGAGCGERSGTRRSHSTMPCARIRAETRCGSSGLRSNSFSRLAAWLGTRVPRRTAVSGVASPCRSETVMDSFASGRGTRIR